jgi:hypothetical protein
LFFYPFYKEKVVYWFFYKAGPSFIKLGQVLSVRADLIGQNLANQLAKFQDKTKPSCNKLIKKILQKHFQNIDDIFLTFNYQPVASASIAQVHKAQLKNSSMVAVKILHPNISKIFYRDIKTIYFLAKIVNIFSDFYAKNLNDIANLLNKIAENLPEALGQVNFAGLMAALKDLGIEVGGLFGDIDLSTPRGLADVIQIVVDDFKNLIAIASNDINENRASFAFFTIVFHMLTTIT